MNNSFSKTTDVLLIRSMARREGTSTSRVGWFKWEITSPSEMKWGQGNQPATWWLAHLCSALCDSEILMFFSTGKLGVQWLNWIRILEHPWWGKSTLSNLCIITNLCHHDTWIYETCANNEIVEEKNWLNIHRWLISSHFAIMCYERPIYYLVINTRTLLFSHPTRPIAIPRVTLCLFFTGNAYWL